MADERSELCVGYGVEGVINVKEANDRPGVQEDQGHSSLSSSTRRRSAPPVLRAPE